MSPTTTLLFWLFCGCVMCAWTAFWLPTYPKIAETPKQAVWLVYSLCFMFGPLVLAYVVITILVDFVRYVAKKVEG